MRLTVSYVGRDEVTIDVAPSELVVNARDRAVAAFADLPGAAGDYVLEVNGDRPRPLAQLSYVGVRAGSRVRLALEREVGGG